MDTLLLTGKELYHHRSAYMHSRAPAKLEVASCLEIAKLTLPQILHEHNMNIKYKHKALEYRDTILYI